MAHSFPIFNLKSRRDRALFYSITWAHYHGDIFFHQDHYEMRRLQLHLCNSCISFPSRAANPNMGHLFMAGQQPDAFTACCAKDCTIPHFQAQGSSLDHSSPVSSLLGHKDSVFCSPGTAIPLLDPCQNYRKTSQGILQGKGT